MKFKRIKIESNWLLGDDIFRWGDDIFQDNMQLIGFKDHGYRDIYNFIGLSDINFAYSIYPNCKHQKSVFDILFMLIIAIFHKTGNLVTIKSDFKYITL